MKLERIFVRRAGLFFGLLSRLQVFELAELSLDSVFGWLGGREDIYLPAVQCDERQLSKVNFQVESGLLIAYQPMDFVKFFHEEHLISLPDPCLARILQEKEKAFSTFSGH